MGGNFNDLLGKSLGAGNVVVGIIMVTMASLLPLGVYADVLKFGYLFGVKLGIAVVLSVLTLFLYYRFSKTAGVPPVSFWFGGVMALGISSLLAFVGVDALLRVFL